MEPILVFGSLFPHTRDGLNPLKVKIGYPILRNITVGSKYVDQRRVNGTFNFSFEELKSLSTAQQKNLNRYSSTEGKLLK